MNSSLFSYSDPYILTPSIFYDYSHCKRCVYERIKHGGNRILTRQSDFSIVELGKKVHSILEDLAMDKNIDAISPQLPTAKGIAKEGLVKSRKFAGDVNCVIDGRFDLLLQFPNGDVGIADIKLIDTQEDVTVYYPQLWATKFAIENSRNNSTCIANRIMRLGLLLVPAAGGAERDLYELCRRVLWHEVQDNQDSLRNLMVEIHAMLEKDVPPEHASGCRKSHEISN